MNDHVWKTEWETYPSVDGSVKLYSAFQRKVPWVSPRVLLVLHGMGEHGGRYAHWNQELAASVSGLVTPDHRGHGKSEGLRGDVVSFDQLVTDAALAVTRTHEKIRAQFGKSEIHLLGHSLGGHVALRLLFLHPSLPIRSAQVSAPFLGIKAEVPEIKKIAGQVLSRLWGTLQLSTGLNASTLSRDPEVVATYQRDRLVHDKMTPRFYTSMLSAIKDTLSRQSGLEVPIQFLIPMADQLVDSEISIQFFNQLKSTDKRLCTFEGSYHETMNDLNRSDFFKDVRSWIDLHAEKS